MDQLERNRDVEGSNPIVNVNDDSSDDGIPILLEFTLAASGEPRLRGAISAPNDDNLAPSDAGTRVSLEERVIRSRGRRSMVAVTYPMGPPYDVRARGSQEPSIAKDAEGSSGNSTLVSSATTDNDVHIRNGNRRLSHEEQRLVAYFLKSPVQDRTRPDPFRSPTPKKLNLNLAFNSEPEVVQRRFSPRKNLARRRILVGSPAFSSRRSSHVAVRRTSSSSPGDMSSNSRNSKPTPITIPSAQPILNS